MGDGIVMRTLLIATLALPVAACGSDPAPAPATNAAVPDDYAARVRALSQGQRDAVLFRAIRDAGRDCQHVAGSTAIADVGGSPAWSARCDNGTGWTVVLNPGGVATVTAADAPPG